MKKSSRLDNFIKISIALLPCTLFFSYYPLIYLGSTSLMNLELSIPLIFLVIFALTAIIYLIKNYADLKKQLPWCRIAALGLLPFYATISILWSKSQLHGLLAAGILWLIYITIVALVWLYRDLFKSRAFCKKCLNIFLTCSVIICIFCWIQSILDLVGIDREYTLMCQGCTYQNFGFPHPSGFMAEPQYLGGVLLAPTLLIFYRLFRKFSKKDLLLAFIFTTTLFLSFSRGAIYAFGIGFVILTIIFVKQKKSAKPLLMLPFILFSFLFTLNAQGIFAAVSRTDDTYLTGISKSLNQLSLGIIDLDFKPSVPVDDIEEKETTNPINDASVHEESAIHDGYVPSSTNGRLTLNKASLILWLSKPEYFIAGAGIGSAGATIYYEFVDPGVQDREDVKKMLIENGVDIPSLNVQSEYAEVIAEFGMIGLVLAIVTIIAFWPTIKKSTNYRLMIPIAVSYLIAMLFCSGLTNSLYLYIMLPYLIMVANNYV